MNDVVIVDAIRTPLGKRNGWLRAQHPVKLGSHVVAALLDRNSIDQGRRRSSDIRLRQPGCGADDEHRTQCRIGC